jgi:hypothetical protein
VEEGIEYEVHLIERFGHTRFHGAFRNVEDLADLAEFEALIMAQNNDHTIGFSKLEERAPDRFGPFLFGRELSGCALIVSESAFAGLVALFVQGDFSAPLNSA